MNIFRFAVVCVLSAVFSSYVFGAEQTRDLLLDWGSFGSPAVVVPWTSYYTGSDYDWDASGRWSQQISANAKSGHSTPCPYFSIGDGWGWAGSEYVNPEKNCQLKLVSGGMDGGVCQYLEVSKLNKWSRTDLMSSVDIVSSADNTGANLQPGDNITFRVDFVKMVDYEDVEVDYTLILSDGENDIKKILTKSASEHSEEVTYTVQAGIRTVYAIIRINTNGDLGSKHPGIYVDDAHLYITRAGKSSYETVLVPAPQNRAIKTYSSLWTPRQENEYSTAASYDYVNVSNQKYSSFIRKLKTLNPNVKVYDDAPADFCKIGNGKHDSWAITAYSYRKAAAENPSWLYDDGDGTGDFVHNEYYPNLYYAKKTVQSYQDTWADMVISRAKERGFDGVFIDDTVPLTRKPAGTDLPLICPSVEVWEIQQFIHRVVPRISAEGIHTVRIGSANNLAEVGYGPIIQSPTWVPGGQYPASKGYTPNTPDNTPAALENERSFFKANDTKISYEPPYWLRCLNDMDLLREWNATLADGKKKMLFMLINGSSNASEEPRGTNGWLQFGLCSYLLGQNDWTVLGFGQLTSGGFRAMAMDVSITVRLGNASGDRQIIGGDQYFQMRRYAANSNGGVGGLVLVNANTDKSKTYILDFDAEDEQGRPIASGTKITIAANTGRIFLNRGGDVHVTLSMPEHVAPKTVMTATVTYVNDSGAMACDVTVSINLPDKIDYVAGSGEATGGTYNASDRTVSWSIGNVAAGVGGTKTCQLMAR